MKIQIERTKQAKELPVTSDLVFGKYFTDHMFVMEYKDGSWKNPIICPFQDISISPAAMVFHYGQAIFEGMKAYRTLQGKIFLFRPEMNFNRLNVSARRLCIPEINEAFCLEALEELLRMDHAWVPGKKGTSLYIRPFIFASEPALGANSSEEYLFMIICSPVGAYYKEGINPVKIMIENDYVRAVRGGTGFAKAAANYAVSLKAQVEANKQNFAQVLWLDGVERKYIEEVGTMNVFFKVNGEIITPSLDSGSILPGITRDSVIQLLRDWDYTVTERKISVEELVLASQTKTLEEAFGTGTAAVISPIAEFTWNQTKIPVGDGTIGPVANRLYDYITNLQNGAIEDTMNWMKEVKI